MKKILFPTLKFGSVGGVLVLLYSSTLVRTGILYSEGFGQYLGYFAIVIMPFCTFLAIKEVARLSGHEVTLKQAMITGLLLSLIAASVYSSLNWVEHALFTNIYEERLIEDTRADLIESGHTEPEIETRLRQIRDFYRSWLPFRNTLIWYCGLGLLYSLGSYLLIKHFFKSKTS